MDGPIKLQQPRKSRGRGGRENWGNRQGELRRRRRRLANPLSRLLLHPLPSSAFGTIDLFGPVGVSSRLCRVAIYIYMEGGRRILSFKYAFFLFLLKLRTTNCGFHRCRTDLSRHEGCFQQQSNYISATGNGERGGEEKRRPSDKLYGRPFPRMRLHSSTFNLAKRTQLPRVIPSCYFLIGHHRSFRSERTETDPAFPSPAKETRKERGVVRNLTVILPRYSMRMGKGQQG